MDPIGLQTASSIPVSRLGCAHDQAHSLSTISIWTVSDSPSAHLQPVSDLTIHSKYFVTMGLRSLKWDEWIGETLSLSHHFTFAD